MSAKLVESLPKPVKIWFANALVGMITADGVVTEAEMEYVKDMLVFMDDVDSMNRVLEMVKLIEKPELEPLEASPKIAARILMHLAAIAITDDKLDESEIEYFKYVGDRMGFESEFCVEVIHWGMDCMELNKRQKLLLQKAQENIRI